MIDPAREQPIAPAVVPASLMPLVAGYDWTRDTVGEAGAQVYRLFAPALPTLFLKHGAGEVAGDVTDEMVRLHWLGRHLPVPRVLHFVASPGDAWLLMASLPGRTACQCLADDPVGAQSTVASITGYLRKLHALPVETCPFNSGHALRLAEARYRLDAGMVDAGGFAGVHRGRTPEAVWREVTGLLPFAAEPVVTHGDFSLDNILLEDGRVTGCIDVGRLGVADRYQDLAILSHCLDAFGGELRDAMWRAYGIADPDRRRIAFHLGLDALF